MFFVIVADEQCCRHSQMVPIYMSKSQRIPNSESKFPNRISFFGSFPKPVSSTQYII